MTTIARPARRRPVAARLAELPPPVLPPDSEWLPSADDTPPLQPRPWRLAMLLAIVLVGGALLGWRLFYWQVLRHDWLQ